MWAAGHANDVPDTEGVKTTELLLARGARLDDVDDRGRSALMMAAELGHGEIIKLLLARRATADLKDKDVQDRGRPRRSGGALGSAATIASGCRGRPGIAPGALRSSGEVAFIRVVMPGLLARSPLRISSMVLAI